MKKLIIFILTLFLYSLNSMEEELDQNHKHLDKKEKIDLENQETSSIVSDIKKKHVLSLKTLTGLIASQNFFANYNNLDESQRQNISKAFQALPQELANFIILCNEIDSLKEIKEDDLLLLFHIIDPDENTKVHTLPTTLISLLVDALLVGCTLLGCKLVNFFTDTFPDEPFPLVSFIFGITKAISTEKLIDMGLNSNHLIDELAKDLESMGKEIDDNQIDLNKNLRKLPQNLLTTGSEQPKRRPLAFAAGLLSPHHFVERKFQTLSYLIKRGANCQSSRGHDLIDAPPSEDLIQFLIKNGANPHVRYKDHHTAFSKILDLERLDLASILIKYKYCDINDPHALAHLGREIINGCVEMVEFYLKNNANIYLQDSDGNLLFEYALHLVFEPNKASEKMIDYAMQTKPKGNYIRIMDMNPKRIFREFPSAAIRERFEIFEFEKWDEWEEEKIQNIIANIFISTGSINDQDEDGNTPLIAACHLNLTKLAKIFIENGADITIEGNAALIEAVNNQNEELINLLAQ